MPRSGFYNLLLLVLFSFAYAPFVIAQAPTTPPTTISKNDPASTLMWAETLNNLEAEGRQPWHLKASYKTFDRDGMTTSTGTYEEWWAGAKRNKHTISATDFTRTDYFTTDGVFRVETGKMSTFIGPEWIKALVHPISEKLADFTTETDDGLNDRPNETCIKLTWRKGNPVVPIRHAYCFDSVEPILQKSISEYNFFQMLYKGRIAFGERYVPKDISVFADQQLICEVGVQQIENLEDVAVVVPPPDAKELPPGSTGPGVTLGSPDQHIVRREHSGLTEAAKKPRKKSEVSVKVTVDRDGHVTDPQVVSGSSIFRDTAANAVTQWEFRPWVANHEPTNVEMTFVFACAIEKNERKMCWYLRGPAYIIPKYGETEADAR